MIPAHALSGLICLHLGQILVKRTDGTSRWTKTPRWAWLVLGLSLAFLSHALIDAMAIFTYHDSSPSGSIFSRLVFGVGSSAELVLSLGLFGKMFVTVTVFWLP